MRHETDTFETTFGSNEIEAWVAIDTLKNHVVMIDIDNNFDQTTSVTLTKEQCEKFAKQLLEICEDL